MEVNKLDIPLNNINLEKVEPLNQKRTLAFLNQWGIQTVSFLNHFSVICEDKLSNLDTKLQRTEDVLAILEARLSSIPGLENVTVPDVNITSAAHSSHTTSSAPPPRPTEQTTTDDNTTAPIATTSDTTATEISPDVEPTAPEAPEETSLPLVSQHPLYAPYFKMVAVGVPERAVKIKMSSLGLDPDILDNPSAPAPMDAAPAEGAKDHLTDSDGELSSWSD